MKKILSMLSIATLGLTLTLAPIKKAEAGILLIMPTGGSSLLFLTLPGGVAAMAGVLMYDDSDYESTLATILMISGGALLLLDAQDTLANKKEFKTIPSYIFSEIESLAKSKIDTAKKLDNRAMEILFNNEEVDEIFQMADKSTDPAELEKLRLALTTSFLK